jgi:hypothetical protein
MHVEIIYPRAFQNERALGCPLSFGSGRAIGIIDLLYEITPGIFRGERSKGVSG